MANHGITRRDFLEGTALAAGGVAVRDFFPLQALGASPQLEVDPSLARGGNLPAAFSIGHWLRDRRLEFTREGVTLRPSPIDSQSGKFALRQDPGRYDVIIVGSGLSGLSTAYHLRRERPGARLLLLDANLAMGGNAGRDDAPPLPAPAATGGAYAAEPATEDARAFYRDIRLDWEACVVPPPFYSYFFDSRTPHALPGASRWVKDVYGKGLASMPYPAKVLEDLGKAREDFLRWYEAEGSPTDPPDQSDPRHDALASRSLEEYLLQDLGFHPAVADFFTRFTVDALGGTSAQVCAHAAISFISAEYHPLFAPPGGTSGIARHLVRWLLPEALPGRGPPEWLSGPLRSERLDRLGSPVRLRQGAVALRAENEPRGASVTYFHRGGVHRAKAKAVVLAGQGHTARHLVGHLLDAKTLEAWGDFSRVPVAVANVLLKRAAPLVELGLGYNQYWWGSRHWADFVIADWVGAERGNPRRPVTLTFYGANERPAEQLAAERLELLTRPFGAYEDSLREDLSRILAGTDFDFEQDVSAIFVYRWGHGMLMPRPGFLFGPPVPAGNQLRRTLAPRHLARRQLGRISFAGQDVEGTPSVESALASGKRCAAEALPFL